MPSPLLPPLAVLALAVPGAAPAGPPPTIDVGVHHVVLEGERLAPRVDVKARGEVVSLRYDCDGDGIHETPAPSPCLFPHSGIHGVSVEARDDQGRRSTAQLTVDVLNTPPWASVRAPRHLEAGHAARFTAVATDADESDTLTYAWEFGDGSTGAGADPKHAYSMPGRYVVRMTVADDEGAFTVVEREVEVERTGGAVATR